MAPSDFGDGSPHQTVEDIAIMRVLPNMQEFCSVDLLQAEAMESAQQLASEGISLRVVNVPSIRLFHHDRYRR